MRKLILALSLLLWTPACSVSSIFSLTPTSTPYIYPTAETPSVPALTVDALRNATYTLPSFTGDLFSYQLTDGKYTLGDPTVTGYVEVTLLDTYAFGDLNEDGVNDAAIVLAENFGGTGVFVSVNAVLNDGGQPRHAASSMIDDRPQIGNLDIRDGEIVLDAVVHAFDDPACCPELSVTRSFKLSGTSLTLVRATSRLPSGQERAITIDSPLDGAEVRGELVITGSVTIAPFENTLTYRVYNEQGNELFAGPIMVSAPDFGAAGTFSATLDISTFPMGRVRIVIADLSAADGSVLAMDSIEIIVR
jgi:Immunoglobulin-like domain of bacterial spore germination